MGINEEKYVEARKMLMEYLRATAHEKGITQEEIASKTGFSRANVSRMLAGKYSPSLDNFMKLSEAVNVYFFIIDKDEDDELVQIMKKRWGNISKS